MFRWGYLLIVVKFFVRDNVKKARASVRFEPCQLLCRACYEGFGTLDLPQVIDGYKPRPLEGVWATPPFLHNGSVPNLYEMLSPVEERSKKFFVGRREFDPVKVGYVTKPMDGSSSGFWLDTTIPGNRNTGHEPGNQGRRGVFPA